VIEQEEEQERIEKEKRDAEEKVRKDADEKASEKIKFENQRLSKVEKMNNVKM